MLTRDRVKEIAEQALLPVLGPAGFVAAEVLAGADFAGDAALYVTARFSPGARMHDSGISLDAAVILQRALEAAGDPRPTYLRYYYPDTPRPIASDKPRDEAA